MAFSSSSVGAPTACASAMKEMCFISGGSWDGDTWVYYCWQRPNRPRCLIMPSHICVGFPERLCILWDLDEFYSSNQTPLLHISALSTQNVWQAQLLKEICKIWGPSCQLTRQPRHRLATNEGGDVPNRTATMSQWHSLCCPLPSRRKRDAERKIRKKPFFLSDYLMSALCHLFLIVMWHSLMLHQLNWTARGCSDHPSPQSCRSCPAWVWAGWRKLSPSEVIHFSHMGFAGISQEINDWIMSRLRTK